MPFIYGIYIYVHMYCTLHRASYFSSTPTDKMYSVVGAAKALYDRLGDIGESSIDGDACLDLWIYVIIKANIKDLVSLLFVYFKKFFLHVRSKFTFQSETSLGLQFAGCTNIYSLT